LRYLASLVCFLCASAAYADLPELEDTSIEARLRFSSVSGKKQFGCQWFDGVQLFVCNAAFDWDNFDPNQHGHGFALDQFKETRLLVPALAPACSLEKVNGLLSSQPDGKSVLSFRLKGKACGDTVRQFHKERLTMEFRNQAFAGNVDEAVLVLRLSVVDLP